jgi:hypothetical protein
MELLKDVGLQPMLERIGEIPVLPHVACSLTDSGVCAPNDVLEIVRVDPGFVLRLITLARTLGVPGEFALPRILDNVGTASIIDMAHSASAFESFVGRTDPASLTQRRWWRESLDAAACSQWLAGEQWGTDPDEAYCAGLLHLFGRPLLDRYGDENYSGNPDACEEELFGCDHVSVLLSLGDQLGLPPRLLSAMNYRCPSEDRLRACVSIANALINRSMPPLWAFSVLEVSSAKQEFLVTKGIAVALSSQLSH